MLVNIIIQDSDGNAVANFDREMATPPRIGEFVKYQGQSYFTHAVAHILQGEQMTQKDFIRIWLGESINIPADG